MLNSRELRYDYGIGMKKTISAIILCMAIFPHSVMAWDIESVSGRFGTLIINNQTDELPVIPVVNTLGLSFGVSIGDNGFFSLEPALDLYWTNYKWENTHAVPTEVESGSGNNSWVLGFILDLPWTISVEFGNKMGAAFSLGTAFVMRAAFAADKAAGIKDIMAENKASIIQYFWQKGRWFYPSSALRFKINLINNFDFSVNVRALLPVYNAWTNPDHFFDEGMLHIFMLLAVGL
ncbi:hypothetical protein MASR2M29_06020 [Spirochaetota bacterium]